MGANNNLTPHFNSTIELLKQANSSAQAVDINQFLTVNMQQQHRETPFSDGNGELNLADLTRNERNLSNCYRILGTINIVASNVLFNWTGDRSYEEILPGLDFDPIFGDYIFEQNDLLKEEDGWFYFITGTNVCEKRYLEPMPSRWGVKSQDRITDNWDIVISYPALKDVEELTLYGVPLSQGIAIFSATTITIDNRPMTVFSTPIPHNLSKGDKIYIDSDVSTGYEGFKTVYMLGIGDGTFKSTAFIVDTVVSLPPILNGSKIRFKRYVDTVASRYHGRWFQYITDPFDMKTYPAGFASNIFSDKIYSYVELNDVDASQFTDFDDKPLTELYVSFIKKQDLKDGEVFWSSISSGIETFTLGCEYDIHTINVNNQIGIEQDLWLLSGYCFGDIVEVNDLECNVYVLSEAYHRINTVNREDIGFFEGNIYKPHYRQVIREFEDNVNIDFSGNTPDNTYYKLLGDGRIAWKNLKNVDDMVVQNSFANGCHYVYDNINLYVERQDPCFIYQQGARSLVRGKCLDLTPFVQQSIENICE